ncbi:MAG: cell division ATP-binding protein FtsE [Zhaonellaceae bacterium]|jgi:cell division transport system ATP-binding protein|nr:cell division ATP-binding protein FtsE [Clostridia bacterium]
MIQLLNVSKIYPNKVQALNDLTVKIDRGEFVFLVGPSGAGKSTFIKLLIREELPTKGQILVGGKSILRLRKSEVAKLRRNIGIVFQDFRLLTDRTVFENVAFAMEVLEHSKKEIRARVPSVLEMVGLDGKGEYFPHQLSGGEQQRVAIARAIVNGPRLLIADEPTGNLDPETSWEIMELLNDINRRGTTVLMATHARSIVNKMRKRVIALEQGRVVRDEEEGGYGYES